MDCEDFREALSAQMDSEALPPGLDESAVAAHLDRCRACRGWLAEVEEVGRLFRVRSVSPAPVLSEGVVEGLLPIATAAPGWKRQVAVRTGLVVVACLQLAIVVPVLLLGHDREAPLHIAHEMGSFDLAVAIGLLTAAHRPRRAAGMFSVVAVAGAALAVTAMVDLARHATSLSDEAPHLLVVAGAVLLWALSRAGAPGLAPPGLSSVAGVEMVVNGDSEPARARLRLLRRAGTESRHQRRVA
jgi:predicted anti-sigma-YlaC factor YlaD